LNDNIQRQKKERKNEEEEEEERIKFNLSIFGVI